MHLLYIIDKNKEIPKIISFDLEQFTAIEPKEYSDGKITLNIWCKNVKIPILGLSPEVALLLTRNILMATEEHEYTTVMVVFEEGTTLKFQETDEPHDLVERLTT